MNTSLKLKTVTGLLSAAVLFLAVSCGKLDVVGTDSVRAFGELLQKAQPLVSEDSVFGGWTIAAPDGGARFIWSRNFAASHDRDVAIEFAAAPFIEAGLDPEKLPAVFIYRDSMLTVGAKFCHEQFKDDRQRGSYEQIVKCKRSAIGYHGQLDHYGINLENGNMFEWAKNMATNDKDMVFVLNPDPFINAGVDVNKVEGWVFGKVTVDDENGKPIQLDKFLKPFDL